MHRVCEQALLFSADVYALCWRHEYVRRLSRHKGDQMLAQSMPDMAASACNRCPVQRQALGVAPVDWDWTSRPCCLHCLQLSHSRPSPPKHAPGCTSHSGLCLEVCCRNWTQPGCFLHRRWRHGVALSSPSPGEMKIINARTIKKSSKYNPYIQMLLFSKTSTNP